MFWQVPVPAGYGCSQLCGGGVTSLYAWAPPAEPLRFPEGTATVIGSAVGTPYVLLEAHLVLDGEGAAHEHTHMQGRRLSETPAVIGSVKLELSPRMPRRVASALAIANSTFRLKPRSAKESVHSECCMRNTQAFGLYAVRVHAHAYARRNAFTVNGKERYSYDPRLPQVYNTPGERVALGAQQRWGCTCEYDTSDTDKYVSVGMTAGDEMCNCYPMVTGTVPISGFCNGNHKVHPSPLLPSAGRVLRTMGRMGAHGAPLPAVPLGEIATGLGQVSALVAGYRGDRGRLLLFHRNERMMDPAADHAEALGGATLSVWDEAEGRVVSSFGRNAFPLPHGLFVEPLSGAIWATDVDAQAAVRFSDGDDGGAFEAVLGTWGQRAPRGSSDANMCRPTAVAVAGDGRVYVTDGYCASRLAVFRPIGEVYALERSIALPSAVVPHGLVLDECDGVAYVAGREDMHLYAVDIASGREMTERRLSLSAYGRVFGLRADEFGELFALCLKGRTSQEPGAARSGFGQLEASIVWLPHGRPVASWKLPGVEAPHDLAVTYDLLTGDRFAYVAETMAGAKGRVLKFRLERSGANSTDLGSNPSGGGKHANGRFNPPSGTGLRRSSFHRQRSALGRMSVHKPPLGRPGLR